MALSESPRLGFDPFAELRRMQGEMNRVFSGFNATAARDFPPINIWLGEHSVVLSRIAGYYPRRRKSQPPRGCAPARQQARTEVARAKRQLAAPRACVRHFLARDQLPFRVDPDKVQARFNNGILESELHRLEADRPKKIEIRAA